MDKELNFIEDPIPGYYVCTKSCTSQPCQYTFGQVYRMDEDGCIYGNDGCGRYLEDTDSEFMFLGEGPYGTDSEMDNPLIEVELFLNSHPEIAEGIKDREALNEIVLHMLGWKKRLDRNREILCGHRGRQGDVPEDIRKHAEWFQEKMEGPYDACDICTAYETGAMDQRKDYRWMTPDRIQLIQKSWYLEGYIDKEYNQKPQFVPDKTEQVEKTIRLPEKEYNQIREIDYENGKKDMFEELKKDAIHCKVFWYDGPLMDYTQEQQDAALERIGAHVDDKILLIILKDEE